MSKKDFLKKTGEHEIIPFKLQIIDNNKPIMDFNGENPRKVMKEFLQFFEDKYG
jgi:hypothetical protein